MDCQIALVSGVFAQLVLAMVFKTIGGFEQSSQWVQFPYIPALLFSAKILCLLLMRAITLS